MKGQLTYLFDFCIPGFGLQVGEVFPIGAFCGALLKTPLMVYALGDSTAPQHPSRVLDPLGSQSLHFYISSGILEKTYQRKMEWQLLGHDGAWSTRDT